MLVDRTGGLAEETSFEGFKGVSMAQWILYTGHVVTIVFAVNAK